MARPPSSQPTDGELELLMLLWRQGPAELKSLCQAIRRHRPVATTTVATMLKVMLNKGLVTRASGPRGYLWSAGLEKEAVKTGSLKRLIDRLFDGSARALVAHMVEDQRLSDEDRRHFGSLLAGARPSESRAPTTRLTTGGLPKSRLPTTKPSPRFRDQQEK